jgi:ribosomal protein L7/L12
MKLLRPKDVSLTSLDKRFKQSPVGKLVASVITLGLCITFITLYFLGKMELQAMLIGTGICFVIFLFVFSTFIQNIAPSAWNLAISSKVIYIKFRSFFNSHFPEDDPQVIKLPFSEIKSVRATKHELKYKTTKKIKNGPTRTGSVTKYQTFLDITVKETDLTPLVKQLDYESNLKCSKNGSGGQSRFHHFPVRVVMPNTIRLEWFTKNTQLKPGIKKTVEMLGQEGLCIEELKKEVTDYTDIASLGQQNIDEGIRQFAITESKLGAIELARTQYGYGLKEAKEFVENLMEEKTE